MYLNVNSCPPDLNEVAEAYCMYTLSVQDAAAFEQHQLMCRRCMAVVQDTERYLRVMRTALRRLRGNAAG